MNSLLVLCKEKGSKIADSPIFTGRPQSSLFFRSFCFFLVPEVDYSLPLSYSLTEVYSLRILPLQSNPFVSLDFLNQSVRRALRRKYDGRQTLQPWCSESLWLYQLSVSVVINLGCCKQQSYGWFNDSILFQRHYGHTHPHYTIVSTTTINRSLTTTLLQLPTYDPGMFCSAILFFSISALLGVAPVVHLRYLQCNRQHAYSRHNW